MLQKGSANGVGAAASAVALALVRVWSCLHWPSTSQMQPRKCYPSSRCTLLVHMVVEEARLLDIIV